MAELEGRTLSERYELRRIIGKGGMANVYEAYDPNIHRMVAIKIFKREDEEMLRRFIREADVMAGLRHPHLVEIYDTGEWLLDGITRYYIVMPLLTGGTLRARIRRSPLTLPEVCQCLNDIGDALDYIHAQGIVHRDIKASNVLLNEEGRCYLTDFGIARITSDATQLTSTGNVLGTVDYVAPELFEVHRRADARSDLYSLGVLLYEMVTGRLPFSADNQLALISMHVNKQPPSPLLYIPQISQAVVGVIYRALEKQPEMRYASAIALADAFCKAVKRGDSVVGQERGQLEPAVLAIEPSGASPTAPASVSKGPVGRASPLAGGTEAFPYMPPPAQTSARPGPLPETPRPPDITQPGLISGPGGARPFSRRVIVLSAVVLTILVVGSVISAYTLLHRQVVLTPTPIVQSTATTGSSPTSNQTSPTPNLTQTAQAGAKATGTANAQASATALANASATANAQASATAGPLQTATAGTPDYQDTLKNGNSSIVNWDENSQCIFDSQGYHVLQPVSFPFYKGCREQSKDYGNFALTVDINILSGHSGGVFFRLSTNLLTNYDGYLFEIDSQGRYKISYEQGAGINTLRDWTPAPSLARGYNQTNLVQLIARGNTFIFYINGQALKQIQNSYYTDAHTIGFLATSEQTGASAEVVYSNLKLYVL
ncbi:MAG TPA: protein kinase [Ktedonobacteraceae bacterium]